MWLEKAFIDKLNEFLQVGHDGLDVSSVESKIVGKVYIDIEDGEAFVFWRTSNRDAQQCPSPDEKVCSFVKQKIEMMAQFTKSCLIARRQAAKKISGYLREQEASLALKKFLETSELRVCGNDVCRLYVPSCLAGPDAGEVLREFFATLLGAIGKSVDVVDAGGEKTSYYVPEECFPAIRSLFELNFPFCDEMRKTAGFRDNLKKYTTDKTAEAVRRIIPDFID